jgi:hypothetical protein
VANATKNFTLITKGLFLIIIDINRASPSWPTKLKYFFSKIIKIVHNENSCVIMLIAFTETCSNSVSWWFQISCKKMRHSKGEILMGCKFGLDLFLTCVVHHIPLMLSLMQKRRRLRSTPCYRPKFLYSIYYLRPEVLYRICPENINDPHKGIT